jgi:hypothetical protein
MSGFKQCSRCADLLPIGAYHACKKEKSGYKSACKECIKHSNASRYLRDKDKILAKTRQWQSENKDFVAKIAKEWRVNNLKKCAEAASIWRKKHPEKSKSVMASYAKKNKSIINAIGARRRALKALASPQWSNRSDIRAFYETAAGLSMLTGDWYHVDHIVPINSKYVCGLHVAANLRVITATENSKKGNRYWPDMPCSN